MPENRLDEIDRHPRTLRPRSAALVICDLQEAFRPVTIDFDAIATRIATLVQGLKLLDVPVLVTEQYPQRLGRTVSSVLHELGPDVMVLDKTAFSCCGASTFTEQLEKSHAWQILLCGLEAHVCVNQTAHDLIVRGHQVHLLLDCITSRTEQNRQIGVEKMRLAGIIPSSVEMALFELMRDAKHEQFKAIQELIK
ncbi:MAG: isochorismatase family protein [Gemmatimonadaceae bacterium]|nr:isochorismatase family protein [Gemmatimonadaceae bacterium]